MSYRNAGDLPPGARIGPLTPYQRPLALLLYILLPLAVSILIGWLVIESEVIRQWLNGRGSSPTEVKHDTIDVAKLAHKLLIKVESRLQDFDNRSKEVFGTKHIWVVDDERAPVPEYVFRYVKQTRNPRFLKNYSALSVDRTKFGHDLRELENRVDQAVSSIPEDATPDRVFQAERVVHREIERAIDALDRCFFKLEELANEFSKESEQ